MHLEQTTASRSMLDWQNEHSFCGRPIKLNSKKIGPKIIACGSENRTANSARSGRADFVNTNAEPMSPSPLQTAIRAKNPISQFALWDLVNGLSHWFNVANTAVFLTPF